MRFALALACVIATTEARADDVTILLGGDVALPAGPNDAALEVLGPRVFEYVQPFMNRVDLVFANLEAPLTTRPAVLKKAFPLTMPPARLAWLVAAGIDVLSLANNHMGDAGRAGVADTIATLKDAHAAESACQEGARLPPATLRSASDQPGSCDARLSWTGADPDPQRAADPVITEVKGVRVGFLAFGNGRAPEVAHFGDRGAVVAKVRAARARVDVLIVSIHGGTEYQHAAEPTLVALFHALADAGADVIVSEHPHVIRGLERYHTTLILHGVGNLAFGSITDRHHDRGATLWGMLPIVHVIDKKVDHLEVVPLWVDNGYPLLLAGHPDLPPAALQPRVLAGPYAQAMLDALAALTRATDPTLTIVRKGDEGWVYLYGPPP